MVKFAAEEYQECKKWIAQKIQEGYSWADVNKQVVDSDYELIPIDENIKWLEV